MKPFAWYDHFNGVFYRSAVAAHDAEEGGNEVTPVYEGVSIPDRRFTAAVAAMQGLAGHVSVHVLAETAVEVANALLAELSKDGDQHE